MGAGTTKSNQNQQSNTSQSNQFGFIDRPINQYFKSAEELISGYDGGASGQREGHARNINAINESGNEFLGANTPDYLRDKVRESRMFRNNLQLGTGLANAKQDEIGFKNQGFMALGRATAPEFVQTGSTGMSNSSGAGSGSGFGSTFLQNIASSLGSNIGSSPGRGKGN